MKFATMRDVTVRHGGRWGLLVSPGGITIISTVDNCHFLESSASHTGGLVRVDSGSTTTHFRNCTFENFHHVAVALNCTVGITFTDCVFEHALGNEGPFLYANRSSNAMVQSGWFEDDAMPDGTGGAKDQWFVQLDQACHSWTLAGCAFMRDGTQGPSQPRVLQVLGTLGNACMSVMLLNPDIAVAGPANSVGANYVDISANDSQVYLVGGIVRDPFAYRRIVVSDVDGLLEISGPSGLRLMRVPDAALGNGVPAERGRFIYNKDKQRLDVSTGHRWLGIEGAAR